ncbi:hypothetical protein D9758_017598 [Tetrapyrgos nigripes]|uniref:DUF6534 domain-containing protein n=1 Tax=Tetrapyrgos nigripes TaxID=182062 RepID=A0A8H5C2S0_9AGAR|nr:hypothetical protein D9758_017598 [Tetrapyrgos nigripes]
MEYLAISGYSHHLDTGNAPGYILGYKLSASSRIAYDVFVTGAIVLSLHHSRSGVKRSDHLITKFILFTVNTNLLTTLLSVSELVTFLALPKSAVYGGLGFMSPKTYINTFLATLNAREYFRGRHLVVSSSELVSTESGSRHKNNASLAGMKFAPFRLSSSGGLGSRGQSTSVTDDSSLKVGTGPERHYELSTMNQAPTTDQSSAADLAVIVDIRRSIHGDGI